MSAQDYAAIGIFVFGHGMLLIRATYYQLGQKRSSPLSLIPAEKARAQSNSFDMSQEQVLAQISHSIDANSKAGQRSIVVSFLKSAVSQQELDGALATVRTNGYTVEMINNSLDQPEFLIRVSW